MADRCDWKKKEKYPFEKLLDIFRLIVSLIKMASFRQRGLSYHSIFHAECRLSRREGKSFHSRHFCLTLSITVFHSCNQIEKKKKIKNKISNQLMTTHREMVSFQTLCPVIADYS